MASRREPPDISVVVTVLERPSSLVELFEEYSAPLRAAGRSFEFVFVAPPYFRSLLASLQHLVDRNEAITRLEAGRSVADTALLRMALGQCRGNIIVTLPAYRQVEADAVESLIERVEQGADFVVARRWPRQDALVNRLQNRILRIAINPLAQGRLHDVACGVRAIRRQVLQDIPLYGDSLRFLPLIALFNGYAVEELPCRQHRGNMRGRVYGPGVYLRRLIDVFGLFFLLRFTEKPLRFFGLVGSVFALSGGALLFWLLLERIGGEAIGGRPLLILGVLLFTVGIQAVALGLIGEMIVHFNAARRKSYRVKDIQPTRRGGLEEARTAMTRSKSPS
jgi:hypothetical protein